jgi:hypothetical protein
MVAMNPPDFERKLRRHWRLWRRLGKRRHVGRSRSVCRHRPADDDEKWIFWNFQWFNHAFQPYKDFDAVRRRMEYKPDYQI